MKSIMMSLGAGIVLGLCGGASGAGQGGDRLPNAALELVRKYPGARVETVGGRVSMVYGRAMAQGATALAAADEFVAEDIGVFGVGMPTLEVARVNELMTSASTVVVYSQSVEGLPVERSAVRVVVKAEPGRQTVAMASARLARVSEGGFRPDAIDGKQAVEAVASLPEWAAMQEFGEPAMVVYAGEGDEEQPIEAVRAWKFVGTGAVIGGAPLKRTFFVDASNGRVVFARDEIHFGSADVSGSVKGWGSPGLLPDDTYNPPALLEMPEILASITGGNSAYSDRMGLFTIDSAMGGPLSVVAGVAAGRWVSVSNTAGGGNISATASGVFPPGPADLVLNAPAPPAGNSFTTAQVNAFIHQTLTHNYFRDRAPTFTGLDNDVAANVNLGSTCNAFFDSIDLSTNFYVQGESSTTPGVFCVNSAYSTVVSHEYGHYIVNRLGLGQGAFGEGFSDTVAMMVYDDPIIARGFRLGNPASFIRSPEAANIQYPCSASCGGAVHCCGQILGGTVWDMRNNFVNAYGPATGIELMRQLHVDWAQITVGGIGSNSAHPQTAVEWLTVDDNDANIDNGTPNYALICEAFGQHGIACPQLALVDFVYPSGRPELVSTTGGTLLRVDIVPITATPAANSGVFFHSVNGAPYTSVPMTEIGTNQYQVAFPASACGSAIRYYVQVGIESGGLDQDPYNAPTDFYSAMSGSTFVTTESFTESSAGWSLGAPGDTATTGQWTFGDPIGTAAQPEDDHTADPGVNCFFTGQGTPGGSLGQADVDGGTTTLVSPAIDLSAAAGARISYWRWYSNDTGGDPNNDVFTVDVSNDGLNWVNVEFVGPTGAESHAGWFFHSFPVEAFVPLSSNVRVRFVASDLGAGSLIEAAVDDLTVEVVECAPPPGCLGDANRDGVVNFEDITVALANFGGSGPQGDADFDGDVDFNDVTVVLAHFLEVCE